MQITPETLADLKAKAQAATPGPWRVNQKWGDAETDAKVPRFIAGPTDAPEAKYIAALSPDVALALIEKVEWLEKEFDTAARSAADESVKAARFESEADWLAEEATEMDRQLCEGYACPYTYKDWREAAHRAVESKPDLFDHLAEHPDTKLAPEGQ